MGNLKPTPGIPGEIYSSLIVMALLLIFCLVVFFKARRADPLKKPKGVMFLAEAFVTFIDGTVEENMGGQFRGLAPYFGFVAAYIFGSFMIGMIGLPTPIAYLAIPFMLALVSFLMIHITSMVYTKWRYFKRFVSPVPFFLPMNLLSMWAPLLSLAFRLFANALAGWLLMYMIYSALEAVSSLIFGGLPYFIAPFIAPVFHAYFDIFSGFIQTTVFIFLSMLFIASEVPDPDEDVAEKAVIR